MAVRLGPDAAVEALLGSLPLLRPLAVFDLESTGASPERDRIIEVAILRIEPQGPRALHDFWGQLVNPGIPIPPSATAVHGIGDAEVALAPRFGAVAGEILERLDGADLLGFNVGRFDIPLLERELARVGLPVDLRAGRAVIDAYRLFVMREPRDLGAALRFYCGREHEGAHHADADVLATLQVLTGQLARYGDIERSVAGLAAAVRDPDEVDRDGKLRWVGDDVCFTFGKHRGRSLRELAGGADRDYLYWVARADFAADLKSIITDAINGRFPVRQAPPQTEPA